MKKYIYILLIISCMFSLVSCTDDNLSQIGSVGDEVLVTLPFTQSEYEEVEIKTRATLDEIPESRVQNIFVYIFVDGKRVYSHYFDTSNLQKDEQSAKEATTNSWWVENMNATGGSQTRGCIRLRCPEITGGNIYFIANIDADMVNISPEKLNMINTENDIMNLTASLNQEITSRNGYFPMAEAITGVNLTNDGISYTENGSSQSNIKLERLDAKVKVYVRAATGYSYGENSSSHSKVGEFVPQSWRVVNIPKGAYVAPRDEDYNESGYFSTEAMGFETAEASTWGSDSQATTNHGFSFYMLENRETMKKTVGGNYHLRDKRIKNADGSYNTENGLWEYAPEESTYIEIKGDLHMDVDESSDAKTQHLTANVTYYIHLGDFGNSNTIAGDGHDNYRIERNTIYTYTITLKGVDNIEVEVATSQPNSEKDFTENQSGATGMVYVSKEETYTFDAHYGQRVFSFDAAYIDPNTVTWYVKTPFGTEGVPPKVNGVEIPAGYDYKWVEFMVNPINDNAYSHLNQWYPGYKNRTGGEANLKVGDVGHLMDVVEFTEWIKQEKIKADRGEANAFRKEYDQDWFDWYLNKNGLVETDITDEVKNDQNQIWWRSRIYLTIFVNEFYYEKHPITGMEDSNLWKKFVNQPNRLMHILCDSDHSLDGESSSTGSIVTIRQHSIQTPYNPSNTNTAWGAETTDETENSYFWFYKETEINTNINSDETRNEYAAEKLVPNSLGNTSMLNGLFNTAKLLSYGSGSLEWSTFLDYERDNDYIADNEQHPRYWMKENYGVLRYTPLMRNRDNNGNGKIDAEELRWYIASIEQLYGLYIGDQGLTPEAQLYNSNKKSYTKNDIYEDNHPLKKGYKYLHHIVSSTKHNKVHTPIVLWAEEGVSTSYYRQEFDWATNNQGSQGIRCIRNLGMPDANDSNILNAEANIPEKLIQVSEPTGSITQDTEFTFDLTRVNPKSLRSYLTTHELEPTDEFNEMSRPYRKFKTGNIFSTGSYESLYNTLTSGYSPITEENYRVPNVREAALMMLYCSKYNDWWQGYIQSASYYSRGKMGAENFVVKTYPTWAFGINFSSVGATATQTRAVSDIME